MKEAYKRKIQVNDLDLFYFRVRISDLAKSERAQEERTARKRRETKKEAQRGPLFI